MLKRTVSLRRFFWVPTTYALVENKGNNFQLHTLIWEGGRGGGAALYFLGVIPFLSLYSQHALPSISVLHTHWVLVLDMHHRRTNQGKKAQGVGGRLSTKNNIPEKINQIKESKNRLDWYTCVLIIWAGAQLNLSLGFPTKQDSNQYP